MRMKLKKKIASVLSFFITTKIQLTLSGLDSPVPAANILYHPSSLDPDALCLLR